MVFTAFTGSIFSVGTNVCVFFPAQVYLQKSNLSLSILQMRHLSIRNKDSGVSNAFTHRKIPHCSIQLNLGQGELLSSGPFPTWLSKFAALCSGGSGP